jgi:hypothetical protein
MGLIHRWCHLEHQTRCHITPCCQIYMQAPSFTMKLHYFVFMGRRINSLPYSLYFVPRCISFLHFPFGKLGMTHSDSLWSCCRLAGFFLLIKSCPHVPDHLGTSIYCLLSCMLSGIPPLEATILSCTLIFVFHALLAFAFWVGFGSR